MKNIIKEIREENSLSQNELATIVGVGRQTIFDLEKGVRSKINSKVLDTVDELGYDRQEVIETYHYQRERQKEEIMQNLK